MISSSPIILLILDGFGISHKKEGNAIRLAHTPNLDFFFSHFPKTALAHSGLAVGLPPGIVGNSEVGHKSIGGGRIVPQTLQTINDSLFYDRWYSNDALEKALNHAKKNKSSIHIIGLLSDGGAHSHIDHCLGILKFLKRRGGREQIVLHLITDGRDMPPQSCLPYLKAIQKAADNYGFAENQVVIGSIGGRFYGMDRNNNWDRIETHYNAMIGQGEILPLEDLAKYIESQYKKDIGDEFIPPRTVSAQNTHPIRPSDALIFFNFRPDRMRQILHAFFDDKFSHFSRKKIDNLHITTATDYEVGGLPGVAVAFPEQILDQTLPEVLSSHGLSQLHLAESEKKAHITYFFGGGKEAPAQGEDRIIIPSPTATRYDQTPGMKTTEIISTLITNITAKKYDFYAVNIAATDMVAHTGNLEASIKTIEILDRELRRLYEIVKKEQGIIILTSDHGNIEEMISSETKGKDTEHNTNPVPFVMIARELERREKSPISIENIAKNPSGTLADIMPTILEIYGLPVPDFEVYREKTGSSLIKRLQ